MSDYRPIKVVINVISEPNIMTGEPREFSSDLIIGQVSEDMTSSEVSEDIINHVKKLLWE